MTNFIIIFMFCLSYSLSFENLWFKGSAFEINGGAKEFIIDGDILSLNNLVYYDLKSNKMIHNVKQFPLGHLSMLPIYNDNIVNLSYNTGKLYFININSKDTTNVINFENIQNISKLSYKEINIELFENGSNNIQLFQYHQNFVWNIVQWENDPESWYIVAWNMQNGKIEKNIKIEINNLNSISDLKIDIENNDIYFISKIEGQINHLFKYDLNIDVLSETNKSLDIQRVYYSNSNHLIFKYRENGKYYIGYNNNKSNEFNYYETSVFQEALSVNSNSLWFYNQDLILQYVEFSNPKKINETTISGANNVLIYNDKIITMNQLSGVTVSYDINTFKSNGTYSISHQTPTIVETSRDESKIAIVSYFQENPELTTCNIIDKNFNFINSILLPNYLGESSKIQFVSDLNTRFDESGKFLTFHIFNNKSYVFDILNNSHFEIILDVPNTILNVEIINEEMAFVSTLNKELLLINFKTNEIISKFKNEFKVKRLFKKGNLYELITINDSGFLELYEFDLSKEEFTSLKTIPFKFSEYEKIKLTNNSKYFFANDFVYDLDNYKPIYFERKIPAYDLCFDFSEQKMIYANSVDSEFDNTKFEIMDVQKGEVIMSKSPYLLFNKYVNRHLLSAFKFFDNGKKVLISNPDGLLSMIDISEHTSVEIKTKYLSPMTISIKNELVINSELNEFGELIVYDYLGRLIASEKVSIIKGKNNLGLKHLCKPNYIFTFKSKNNLINLIKVMK